MKGIKIAIPGAIVSLVGWWGPWLDFGNHSWMRGDLLVRDDSPNNYGPFLPAGADPQPYIILLVVCYAAFVGLAIFAVLRNHQLVLAWAAIDAIFIVLLDVFFLANAAVFAYSWEPKFILVWQWGPFVMFAGLAVMLWGVFTEWVDREVTNT